MTDAEFVDADQPLIEFHIDGSTFRLDVGSVLTFRPLLLYDARRDTPDDDRSAERDK